MDSALAAQLCYFNEKRQNAAIPRTQPLGCESDVPYTSGQFQLVLKRGRGGNPTLQPPCACEANLKYTFSRLPE
jgi:hypothetical protein